MAEIAGPLVRSMGRRGGAGLGARTRGLATILAALAAQYREQLGDRHDPLAVSRRLLAAEGDEAEKRLEALEAAAVGEVREIVDRALMPSDEPGGDGSAAPEAAGAEEAP